MENTKSGLNIIVGRKVFQILEEISSKKQEIPIDSEATVIKLMIGNDLNKTQQGNEERDKESNTPHALSECVQSDLNMQISEDINCN